MKKLTFVAHADSENPTKTVVKARNFQFIIDEPAELAGTDHGPNPVEFVLGALAGCLNVVGHIVAREMGFELRGITFELAGDLNPSKFAGQETSERAGYQEIRVTVTPDSDADIDTLKEWLLAVEQRCPVSDNLMNATPVNILLG